MLIVSTRPNPESLAWYNVANVVAEYRRVFEVSFPRLAVVGFVVYFTLSSRNLF